MRIAQFGNHPQPALSLGRRGDRNDSVPSDWIARCSNSPRKSGAQSDLSIQSSRRSPQNIREVGTKCSKDAVREIEVICRWRCKIRKYCFVIPLLGGCLSACSYKLNLLGDKNLSKIARIIYSYTSR